MILHKYLAHGKLLSLVRTKMNHQTQNTPALTRRKALGFVGQVVSSAGALGDDMNGKNCKMCFKFKPLSDFYAHPKMADGFDGKCKECAKEAVRKNYRANRLHYVEYERQRFKDPSRKAAFLKYQRQRRKRFPHKSVAWSAVSNAIRDGKLVRLPCEKCGNPKSQAHHTDYSKPLDVQWLCFKHHREAHGQTVTEITDMGHA